MLQKNRFSRSFWNGYGKHRMRLRHWESENMLRNAGKDYEKQLEDLRNMENEFAACFPENIDL